MLPDSFFDSGLSVSSKALLVTHEIGHSVATNVIAKEDGWLDTIEPFKDGMSGRIPLYGGVAGTRNARPEEFLSDVYSDLLFGGKERSISWGARDSTIAVYDMIEKGAARIGLPSKQLFDILAFPD
jgi:hypothetical protein